jgi:excisionase family DNA binding protein
MGTKDKTTEQAPRRALKVSETAARGNVADDTVIRLLRAGKLHGFRFGNSWRVYEDSLEEYIRSTSTQPE